MILLIAAGAGLIIMIAIIVGIVDAAQASAWRRIAQERRHNWESKLPEYHGVDSAEAESWDDD
ncbi:hypothetical protein [Pseudonocardia sp. TRM90224]|uniref:hypothetical protein n=1 Tax=Pseudonocardia sp. TRM90224 TaxID=2812678 RepID=UPI001E5091FE|nr:hypothetical protein [Pseudonocardia sp. TRM90224]